VRTFIRAPARRFESMQWLICNAQVLAQPLQGIHTHKHRYSPTNVAPPPGQEQDAAVVCRDVGSEIVHTRYVVDEGCGSQPINLLQVLSWRKTRETRERTSG
jgi:hypothetical protein